MLGLIILFDLPVNASTTRLDGTVVINSCATILKGDAVALFGTGKTDGRGVAGRGRRRRVYIIHQ